VLISTERTARPTRQVRHALATIGYGVPHCNPAGPVIELVRNLSHSPLPGQLRGTGWPVLPLRSRRRFEHS
jgi:hypothetical protein